MDIKRVGSQPSAQGSPDWFTGTVRIDPLFQAPDPAFVQGASVTFEPGARTHGTRIPLARLSSLLLAAAGFSTKGDRSKRSGLVMWSGSRPERSTGTALRRRQRSRTSPFTRRRTARWSTGWTRSATSNIAVNPRRSSKEWEECLTRCCSALAFTSPVEEPRSPLRLRGQCVQAYARLGVRRRK